METILLFWCVGILLFWVWLRPSTARAKQMADDEFAGFVNAVAQWQLNRTDVTVRACALNGLSLYERRMRDLCESTAGASLPRERSLIAGFWLQHLFDAGLLNDLGGPCKATGTGRDFWEALVPLRSEQDRLRPRGPDAETWVGAQPPAPIQATRGSA